MTQGQRRLAAIMFTDIAGYGALTQRNESLALDLLSQHNHLLRPIFTKHHGKEIKSMGDGFFLEFSSALNAVQCAVEMQQALQQLNEQADEGNHLSIRIGIHLGDVEDRDGDIFGDGVNIASRLEAIAEPGQIYLSTDVANQVRNKMDQQLIHLGQKPLKNIEEPMDVFRVDLSHNQAKQSASAMPVRRNLRIASIAIVVVLMMVGAWLLNQPSISQDADDQNTNSSNNAALEVPTQIESIAVLPFVNLSNSEEDEYFSDGLTEELINAIAQMGKLRVISRTSAFSYKGKDVDIRTIGEELNVDAVLEGSVRRSGDTIRVNTQLIRVADDSHLWSETFDQEMEDVFSIQEEIAKATVETLKLQLNADVSQFLRSDTENFEAYENYLQGRFFWSKRTQEGFSKAIEYFETALDIDPNYARAYAGLADNYSLMVVHDMMSPNEGHQKAKEAALRALELDDQLAEAHTSLAYVQMNSGNLDQAEESFQRAISINPNYATAYQWYANMLRLSGRGEESLSMSLRALERDPLSSIINASLGEQYAERLAFDLALERFEKALELDPDFMLAHIGIAEMKEAQFDWEGASQAYQNAIDLEPQHAVLRYLYAVNLLRLGMYEEAFEEINQGWGLNPDTAWAHFVLGIYHYFNRDFAEAIEEMNKTLLRDNGHEEAYLYLSLSYAQQGVYDEALEALRNTQVLVEQEAPIYGVYVETIRGMFLARMGNHEEARNIIENLKNHVPVPDVPLWTGLASVHFELGDLDGGFEFLQKAFDAREDMLHFLKIDPIFDSVRDDPRFDEFLVKLNLKDQT